MGCDPFFVAVEGIEGSGKTEFCDMAIKYMRTEEGLQCLYVKEPSSKGWCKNIREAITLFGRDCIPPLSQLFLFMAQRHQNYIDTKKLITSFAKYDPKEPLVIFLDRFIDSTLVYQGILGGIPLDYIRKTSYEAWPITPDLTITINGDPAKVVTRVANRDEQRDSLANDTSYLSRASDAFKLINASRSDMRVMVDVAGIDLIDDIVSRVAGQGRL